MIPIAPPGMDGLGQMKTEDPLEGQVSTPTDLPKVVYCQCTVDCATTPSTRNAH